MKVSVNPAGFEAEHLAALNRSFGDWGDGRRWQWCFARSSLSEPADILVAEVNGAAIAGTGISYRRMITPDGGTLLAGILTAAWSRPVKSARGAYMHVMSEAMRRIAERGGAVALGFMPQNMSSGLQLQRAGAMAATTAYVSTPAGWNHGLPGELKPCVLTSGLIEELFRRVNRRAQRGLRFTYQDIGEFAGQFLERPHPVEVFADVKGGYFILERLSQAMNLLAVLPADGDPRAPGQHLMDAAQLAADQHSKLLCYASNEQAITEAVAAGLVAKPGFITVTIANVQALSAAGSIALEGNGAATSACLAMLRTFHVENGDRM